MKIKRFFIITVMFAAVFCALPVHAEPNKIGAQGAVLVDYESGRVLWGKNEDEPLAMASTTKIMTAIIALEYGNMSDITEISPNAAAAPPVKMKLKKGEKIKLEYLMYALMLQSSNDAAVAIAEHIGGNVGSFCTMMTDKAKEIGCRDTVFETPNGLDKGDHHSTPRDMALIARYALHNDNFRKIIATSEITFKSDKTTYYVSNKNRLLREYNGAIGVKTGFTGKAGHCFVGAAERNGVTLISVVLASGWGSAGKEGKWRDTKAILDYGFSDFKYYDILFEGDTAGNFDIVKGETEKGECIYKNSFKALLSKEEYNNIRIENNIISTINAPAEAGKTIGKAAVYSGKKLIGEVEIVNKYSVLKKDFFATVGDVLKVWMKILLSH